MSTRSVDDLVQAMGMTGISKSQVSRLCGEIDDKVQTFLNRPLEQNADWAVQRARYMRVGTMAPLSDDPIVSLPAVAA